jgi:hypothetical protein
MRRLLLIDCRIVRLNFIFCCFELNDLLFTFSVIADFGGLLGLFLGCSILSLIELIFFTVAGCWKLKLKGADVEKNGGVKTQEKKGANNIQ